MSDHTQAVLNEPTWLLHVQFNSAGSKHSQISGKPATSPLPPHLSPVPALQHVEELVQGVRMGRDPSWQEPSPRAMAAPAGAHTPEKASRNTFYSVARTAVHLL